MCGQIRVLLCRGFALFRFRVKALVVHRTRGNAPSGLADQMGVAGGYEKQKKVSDHLHMVTPKGRPEKQRGFNLFTP